MKILTVKTFGLAKESQYLLEKGQVNIEAGLLSLQKGSPGKPSLGCCRAASPVPAHTPGRALLDGQSVASVLGLCSDITKSQNGLGGRGP